MKTILLLAGITLAGWSASSAQPLAPEGGVTFDVFYNSLGQMGEWLTIDDGVYAWRPTNVPMGWRPYVDGQWVWTDDGWFWASDEPWAWAVYHYGRWYYDDYYGWVWVPGYDWAPAWVEWRYGGPYIGWAPLGPYAVFSDDYGVYYRRAWETPYDYWVFMDCQYINSPNAQHYIYRTEYNARFLSTTRRGGSVRVVSGRVVTRGPEPGYVERRGAVRVVRVDVKTIPRPQEHLVRDGDKQTIEIYRPRIEPAAQRGVVDRPANLRQMPRALSLDMRQTDLGTRMPYRQTVDESAAQRQGAPVPTAERSMPEKLTPRGEPVTRVPEKVEPLRPAKPRGETYTPRSVPDRSVQKRELQRSRTDRPQQPRYQPPRQQMRERSVPREQPRPASRPESPRPGRR